MKENQKATKNNSSSLQCDKDEMFHQKDHNNSIQVTKLNATFTEHKQYMNQTNAEQKDKINGN